MVDEKQFRESRKQSGVFGGDGDGPSRSSGVSSRPVMNVPCSSNVMEL
jgi:hypothetical protein